MSSRVRRTLIDNAQLIRRSPRLSSKEPESRNLTPPRPSRTKLTVPQSVVLEQPAKTVGSQVTTEFSDEDLEISNFETDRNDRPSGSGSSVRQWQERLWTSLLNAEDKGRKQEETEESWSKRDLFAVFVLIPLIIGLLALSIWCMTYGVNMADIMPSVFFVRTLPWFKGWFTPNKIEVSNQPLDVDLLIDKILSNDIFKEMITASSSETDKLMYFAKDKIETMEKEHKAKNEAWIKEMTEKINIAKNNIDEMKKVDSLDDLKKQLEILKSSISTFGDSNNAEISSLQENINNLVKKHDELKVQLANCKTDEQAIRVQMEENLKSALKDGLMSKEEFSAKMAETQHDLLYGLESKVLDKVRNDPVIMEKMSLLAQHQTGQQFSKDDVVNIVHEALTVYDADRTGLFDFALESAGGTIASTRCTETYDVTQAVYHVLGVPIWWERQNPRTILQPGSAPGQCWAFKGSEGCVVIKLSNPVFISNITLEHIAKNLSPDRSVLSAPRQFEVLGLENVEDPNPVHLGNFTYDTDNLKNPVQTFKINQLSTRKSFAFVELKILSNYGHPEYTCIYRFRVHGSLQ